MTDKLHHMVQYLHSLESFVWVLYIAVIVILLVLFIKLYSLGRKKWKKKLATEQEAWNNERLHILDRIRVAEQRATLSISNAESSAKMRVKAAEESAQKKVEDIQKAAEERITTAQEQATRQVRLADEYAATRIREERETIDAEKDKLMSLSDKELLVEAVFSLSTFSTRFDRLETEFRALTTGLGTIRARLENVDSNTSILTKREIKRRNNPCDYTSINPSDLKAMAERVVKGNKRIKEVYVDGSIVHCVVLSNQGLSTWAFELDFNDDGIVTGEYYVFSEVAESSLPSKIGDDIKKEILFKLNR